KMETIERSRSLSRESFSKMEEAFLKMTRKEECPRLLVGAFEKILVTHSKARAGVREEAKQVVTELDDFFCLDRESASFSDCIVAFNMVQCRKYLAWRDLFRGGAGESFGSEYYDCSLDVLRKLVQYVKDLERDIEELKRRKARIEWLKDRSRTGGVGGEARNIIAFYEELGHSWQADSSDVLALLPCLLAGVIEKLDKIIRREWELLTSDEKVIRTRLSISDDLQSLLSELCDEHDLVSGRQKVMMSHAVSLEDYLRFASP
ncbi:unnamed protein product, partial [marine sediment metagenome]